MLPAWTRRMNYNSKEWLSIRVNAINWFTAKPEHYLGGSWTAVLSLSNELWGYFSRSCLPRRVLPIELYLYAAKLARSLERGPRNSQGWSKTRTRNRRRRVRSWSGRIAIGWWDLKLFRTANGKCPSVRISRRMFLTRYKKETGGTGCGKAADIFIRSSIGNRIDMQRESIMHVRSLSRIRLCSFARVLSTAAACPTCYFWIDTIATTTLWPENENGIRTSGWQFIKFKSIRYTIFCATLRERFTLIIIRVLYSNCSDSKSVLMNVLINEKLKHKTVRMTIF